jgi:hypothetical protein
MKKIFTLLFVGVVGMTLNAQRSTNNTTPAPVSHPSQPHFGNPVLRGADNASRANAYWYNYALQLDDPSGFSPGMADPNFFVIFPDSNIIIGQYSTGDPAYAQFHKAATLLDPKNMPVQSFNSALMYSLDSLAIGYAYSRATANTVVDTLIIEIIKHDASLQWDLTNATYQDITYVQSSNTITASQVLATYTYLLTESDSTSFASEILIATPGVPNQAGTNRIGAVVSFKPGYSYSITDSIFQKNGFYLFSFEQNGASTDPTFYGTITDGNSDLNCSYALPTSVRYNTNAQGWNGYFIPTWAWTTPYAHEHHIISFLLSEVVSVNENSNISTYQNYPNPCNDIENIKYSLKNSAAVTISITDIAGKTIAVQNEGVQLQGEHNTTVNTNELANGVYFITLTAGEEKSVSRLVVQH